MFQYLVRLTSAHITPERVIRGRRQGPAHYARFEELDPIQGRGIGDFSGFLTVSLVELSYEKNKKKVTYFKGVSPYIWRPSLKKPGL